MRFIVRSSLKRLHKELTAMTRTHEMIAEQNFLVRALPYSELERRIVLGILSGRVIDGRKRFGSAAR